MKKIIQIAVIIFASLLPAKPIIPQQLNFAVIADPLVDARSNNDNLIRIIKDLNVRMDLEFVIFIGNLTATGSSSDLFSAENILSRIDKPYYIIPGKNDISGSVDGGVGYIQTFGSDGFAFTAGEGIFVSINPFIPFNKQLQFISVDENRRNINFIKSSGLNKTFIFSSVNPRDIENAGVIRNWFSHFENVVIFYADQNDYSRDVFESADLVGLNNNPGAELYYHRISLEKNSVSIFKRSLSGESDLLVDQIESSEKEFETSWFEDIEIYSGDVRIVGKLQLSEYHLAPAITDNGMMYTASRSGNIRAIDERGKIKWEYSVGGTIFYSPVKHKDILAVSIYEGDLVTFNANNGDVLQIIGLGETIGSALSLIDIKYNGYDTKGIIVVTSSGDIFCYELYSLELVWSQKVFNSVITSSSIQIQNLVISSNWEGDVIALNSDTGSLIWKFNSGKAAGEGSRHSRPVSDGQRIFFFSDKNTLTALDLLQGRLEWNSTSIPHQFSIAFLEGENLLIKGPEGMLSLISGSNGKIIKTSPLGESKFFPNKFETANNKIITGSSTGDVILIDNNLNASRLFNSFGVPILSVLAVTDSVYAALDINGNLIMFELSGGTNN